MVLYRIQQYATIPSKVNRVSKYTRGVNINLQYIVQCLYSHDLTSVNLPT
jgi:hypothetical protein